jgi:hypothetical protein
MVNFYRQFLPKIAQILTPLTNLLKGKDLPKVLPWDQQHDAAFAAAVPLAHPRPEAALALATNTSDTYIGGVLQQQVGGHWQPLGFFSRRLQPVEANYSTFDRELLVADQAIKHFLPQVEGRVFQLWTDHKPLVAAMMRVTPPISGRQQRHLAFISEHTCDVRHTPSVDNVVADALSRPPSPHPLFPCFFQSGSGCGRGGGDGGGCGPLAPGYQGDGPPADTLPTGTKVAAPAWPENRL